MKNKTKPIIVAALFAAVQVDAMNSITRGSWAVYLGATQIASGLSSEQACVDAIIARSDATATSYTCRETIKAVQVGLPSPAPPPPTAFSSTFGTAEFPLSENGVWRHTLNPWTFVRTLGGVAFGSNGVTNSYDDSYAYFAIAATDYTIEATVQVNDTCADTCELELLLRMTDDSNTARAVEMAFWRNGIVQAVRWNGPFGSFYPYTVTDSSGCAPPWTPSSALATGDKIKAQASGNVFRAWVNGVLKVCVNDSTMTKGAPGIGFFVRPGVTNNALSISDVTITMP